MLYVGSMGPVAALTRIDKLPDSPWLHAFYFPVEWLYDHTPMSEPMDLYLDWWEERLK